MSDDNDSVESVYAEYKEVQDSVQEFENLLKDRKVLKSELSEKLFVMQGGTDTKGAKQFDTVDGPFIPVKSGRGDGYHLKPGKGNGKTQGAALASALADKKALEDKVAALLAERNASTDERLNSGQ